METMMNRIKNYCLYNPWYPLRRNSNYYAKSSVRAISDSGDYLYDWTQIWCFAKTAFSTILSMIVRMSQYEFFKNKIAENNLAK